MELTQFQREVAQRLEGAISDGASREIKVPQRRAPVCS